MRVSAKAVTAVARRARRGAEPALPTREVILDTAERLFAVRGVDGVAVRDLAREMDLTAPSLYNHFPSKQALVRRGARARPASDRRLSSPRRGIRARCAPITCAPHSTGLSNIWRQHPHLARLLQRALLEDGSSMQALLARWLSPLYREGFAVIRETAERRGLGTPPSCRI